MAWLKVDDGFLDHRKVIGLSKDARLLWLAGALEVARQLTDGHLSQVSVGRILRRDELQPAAAEELVAAGLWHSSGHDCGVCPDVQAGDLFVHEYLDYNPSAAKVQGEREKARTRMSAVRKRRRSPNRSPERSGEHKPNNDRSSASPSPSPSPSPSRVSPAVSSSLATPDGDDDRWRATLDETYRLMGEKRLDQRDREMAADGRGAAVPAKNGRREKWIKADAAKSRTEFDAVGRAYLLDDPTLSPTQLADLLSPDLVVDWS